MQQHSVYGDVALALTMLKTHAHQITGRIVNVMSVLVALCICALVYVFVCVTR